MKWNYDKQRDLFVSTDGRWWLKRYAVDPRKYLKPLGSRVALADTHTPNRFGAPTTYLCYEVSDVNNLIADVVSGRGVLSRVLLTEWGDL